MKHSYTRDGFTYVERAFPKARLDAFERGLCRVADKLGCAIGDDPLTSLREAERSNPQAFYSICSQGGGTLAGLNLIASENLQYALGEIFGLESEVVQPTHPVVFWNDADVKRLQYDWHQEANYFHGVPDGCHVWFPLFEDTTHTNGPMLIAKGSHRSVHGYRHEKRANALTQLIPLIDVEKEFEIHECVCKRGDAVIFHHNAIHCTGPNISDRPRASGIIRVINSLSASTWLPMMEFTFKSKVEQSVADDGWDGTGPGHA